MTGPDTQTAHRGLTRVPAVALAFCSVVGAGLTSLPAAVVHESGSAALLVWLIAMLICVPMLVVFRDSVTLGGESADPLRESVTQGLGARWGDAVPIAFALVVIVGLPSNAVVAGQTVGAAIGVGIPPAALAAGLLAVALGVNVVGGKAGSRTQIIGAIVLVTAVLVGAIWALTHAAQTPALGPTVSSVAAIPRGILLAFWAFVGFENLVLMSRDLANAKRDFMPVAVSALILLTTLAMVLSVAVAAHQNADAVNPVTGLVDAAGVGAWGSAARLVVAGAGVVGILVNAVAWIRGVALLVDTSARGGLLPSSLAGAHPDQPRRAMAALGAGFLLTLTVLLIRPSLVIDTTAAASGVFVVIYLLCILAYRQRHGRTLWATINLAIVPLLIAVLLFSGWRTGYAVVVMTAAILIAARARRRTRVDARS